MDMHDPSSGSPPLRAPQESTAEPIQIVILGDLFRVASERPAGGTTWLARPNCEWLQRLVAAGLPDYARFKTAILTPETLGINQPETASSSTEMLLWHDRAVGSVADEVLEKLADKLAGHIVIAFELPPSLLGLAIEKSALFVEVEISPFRFTEEMLLRVSTSDASLERILDENMIRKQALVRTIASLRFRLGDLEEDFLGLPQTVGLIAAQVEFDRSLFNEDGFLSLADFVDEIRAMRERHDLLLIAPHPHAHIIPGLAELCEISGLRVTRANSYRLLASGRVAELAAISSSLLQEAPCFGVAATRWAPVTSNFTNGRDVTATALMDALTCRLDSPCDATSDTGALLQNPAIKRSDVVQDWSGGTIFHRRNAVPGYAIIGGQGTVAAVDPDFDEGLTLGWYGREQWGVWGQGPVGVVTLRWDEPNVTQLVLTIELTALISPQDTYRMIEIFSDGKHIGSCPTPGTYSSAKEVVVVDCTEGQRHAQFWLRAECIAPRDIDPAQQDDRPIAAGLVGLAWRKIFRG